LIVNVSTRFSVPPTYHWIRISSGPSIFFGVADWETEKTALIDLADVKGSEIDEGLIYVQERVGHYGAKLAPEERKELLQFAEQGKELVKDFKKTADQSDIPLEKRIGDVEKALTSLKKDKEDLEGVKEKTANKKEKVGLLVELGKIEAEIIQREEEQKEIESGLKDEIVETRAKIEEAEAKGDESTVVRLEDELRATEKFHAATEKGEAAQEKLVEKEIPVEKEKPKEKLPEVIESLSRLLNKAAVMERFKEDDEKCKQELERVKYAESKEILKNEELKKALGVLVENIGADPEDPEIKAKLEEQIKTLAAETGLKETVLRDISLNQEDRLRKMSEQKVKADKANRPGKFKRFLGKAGVYAAAGTGLRAVLGPIGGILLAPARAIEAYKTDQATKKEIDRVFEENKEELGDADSEIAKRFLDDITAEVALAKQQDVRDVKVEEGEEISQHDILNKAFEDAKAEYVKCKAA